MQTLTRSSTMRVAFGIAALILAGSVLCRCPTPPRGWLCDASLYNSGKECNCGCGVYDPDCDVANLPILSCDSGQYCAYDGTCAACDNAVVSGQGVYLPVTTNTYGICFVSCHSGFSGASCQSPSKAPANWECPPHHYNGDDGCHCGCGAPDPDCEADKETVIDGCEVGEYCNIETGTCSSCGNKPINGKYSQDGSKGLAVNTIGMCAVDCDDGVDGYNCDDYCQFEACEAIPFERFSACLDQTPFSNDTRKKTLDSVAFGADMYVFKDIIQEPPQPLHFPDKIDVKQTFQHVYEKEYKNDNEFQEDLAEAFIPLFDAHTLYIKPGSYRDLFFMLPINIAAVEESDGEDSTTSIYISSVVQLAGWGKDISPIDLSSLVGARVDIIDGVAAFDYLRKFSDSVIGLSKDPGTRFNIATGGSFVMRSLIIRSRPDSPSVSLKCTNSTSSLPFSVDIPWVGYSRKKIAKYEQLQAQYSPPSVKKLQSSGLNENAYIEEIVPDVRAIQGQSETLTVSTSDPHRVIPITLIVDENDVKFYKLSEDTGVLKISTFLPQNLKLFRYAIVDSVTKAQSLGISKLMIDFRGNGGGYICLGYALLKYLVPTINLYNMYDVLAHPTFVDLAKKATKSDPYMWNPQTWASAKGVPFEDASWITETVTRQWGDNESTYSSLFRDNCEAFMSDWPVTKEPFFAPANILVVTDGYCGSTCAVFTLALQEAKAARTLVYGGIAKSPQMPGSFPGGQVYSLNRVIQDMRGLNISNSANMPPSFPTSADFSFTIREIYSRQVKYANIPLEYVWNPSNFRIQYTLSSATNNAAFYQDAARFFDFCEKDETRPCLVNNGVGVQKCSSVGTFVDQCTVVQCDEGFQESVDACLEDEHPLTWRDYFAYAFLVISGIGFFVFIYRRWKDRPQNLRAHFMKIMNLTNPYAIVRFSKDGILGEELSDASEESNTHV